MRICVCVMQSTCNCDAASGEHLDSGLDVFDPVRGSRMELWFIAGKQKQTHGEVLITERFQLIYLKTHTALRVFYMTPYAVA